MNAPVSTVHLYVLLDRSGSMASMAEQVVTGFNRLLADQQADGQDARITLVQFDSVDAQRSSSTPSRSLSAAAHPRHASNPAGGRRCSTPRAGSSAAPPGAPPIWRHRPASGGSPVRDHHRRQENDSREFNQRQIVELVLAREGEGWTFVFLGAGLDAYREAGGLGYDRRSVQSFAADGTGADLAFASLSAKTRDLRRSCARGERFDRADFFEGDKPAEADRNDAREVSGRGPMAEEAVPDAAASSADAALLELRRALRRRYLPVLRGNGLRLSRAGRREN